MRKLAPLLCAAALTLSLAMPAGAYYASNEDGSNEPGDPITSVSVTSEPVAEPTLPSLGGLTPDGNLALIDDILGGAYYSSEEVGDSQMQFVTWRVFLQHLKSCEDTRFFSAQTAGLSSVV